MILALTDLPAPGDAMTCVTTLEDAASAVADSRHEGSLVVCTAGTGLHVGRAARALVEPDDVTVVEVDGYATARHHLHRALATLGPEDYALAPAVARAVGATLRTRLALASVTQLSRPAPSITQHVRSWFPGAAYLVDVTAGTIEPAGEAPWPAPGEAEIAVHAAEGTQLPAYPPRAGDIALGGVPRPSWASASWVEVTSGPRDPARTVRTLLTELDPVDCPGCARRTLERRCPACGCLVESPNAHQVDGTAPATVDVTRERTSMTVSRQARAEVAP